MGVQNKRGQTVLSIAELMEHENLCLIMRRRAGESSYQSYNAWMLYDINAYLNALKRARARLPDNATQLRTIQFVKEEWGDGFWQHKWLPKEHFPHLRDEYADYENYPRIVYIGAPQNELREEGNIELCGEKEGNDEEIAASEGEKREPQTKAGKHVYEPVSVPPIPLHERLRLERQRTARARKRLRSVRGGQQPQRPRAEQAEEYKKLLKTLATTNRNFPRLPKKKPRKPRKQRVPIPAPPGGSPWETVIKQVHEGETLDSHKAEEDKEKEKGV